MDQALVKRCQEALDRAKYSLVRKKEFTFVTTVLYSLKVRITDEIPTLATDGISLLINPEFFLDELDDKTRVTALLHEAWHVAFNHTVRRGNRDPKRFNIAGDYVINLLLTDAGCTAIDGWLWDRQYSGMTTEQVYDLLPEQPSEEPDFGGDLMEIPDGTPEAAQIKETMLRGKLAAQAIGAPPGSIPGEIDRGLEKYLNPKLPWYTILYNELTEMCPDDYTMRKANRRFLPDYYLPTLWSEGALDHLAIAFDLSGSVSNHQINQGLTEMQAIRDTLNPQKLTVIGWDTCLTDIHELSPEDRLQDVTFNGGGGTDIDPVMHWTNNHKPEAIVIFTDGRFHSPTLDPKVRVYWIINDNPRWEQPFGSVVHYETR